MGHAVSEKPAIAGGVPAKQTQWGSEPRFGEEELQQLKEALDQGTLFYALGKKVRQLERDFAEKSSVGFAVACTSGTAAIHAAMIALGISPGDEVIVTSVTDMGSLIPILYQGGVPVFADLHPYSYEMLPEAVEAAITPQTRAVLAVHLWGNACDLNALQQVCARRNLALVEDCAQALGCRYDGKPIGTIGRIGCFSLNEYKHINCGDGGLVITDDPDLAHRLRLATDKCYDRGAGPHAGAILSLWQLSYDRVAGSRGRCSTAEAGQHCGAPAHLVLGTQRAAPGAGGAHASRGDAGLRALLVVLSHADGPGSVGSGPADVRTGAPRRGADRRRRIPRAPVYEYPIFTDHSVFARGSHPYERRQYAPGALPNHRANPRDRHHDRREPSLHGSGLGGDRPGNPESLSMVSRSGSRPMTAAVGAGNGGIEGRQGRRWVQQDALCLVFRAGGDPTG